MKKPSDGRAHFRTGLSSSAGGTGKTFVLNIVGPVAIQIAINHTLPIWWVSPRTRDLFEHFHPLATHWELKVSKTGDVAAGPCEAIDETSTHWIDDPYKHNWYRVASSQIHRSPI